jgi:hypothetical protein
MNMTIDKRIRAERTGNRKLPSVAPRLPPKTTATASKYQPCGTGRPELISPTSPDMELTKMNNAETADAVLVLAHPKINKRGVK